MEDNKKTEGLYKRENQTLERIIRFRDASAVLMEFYEAGFKHWAAFEPMVMCFIKISVTEKRLFDYWNLKKVDNELTEELKRIIKKII